MKSTRTLGVIVVLGLFAGLGAWFVWSNPGNGDGLREERVGAATPEAKEDSEEPEVEKPASTIESVAFEPDEPVAGESGLYFSGKVVDKESEAFLPGAEVALRVYGSGKARNFRSKTKADGTFRFGPIDGVKTYRCVARFEGYAPGFAVQGPKAQGRKAGETLELGSIALPRGARLKGRVVDDLSGRAISGATVVAGNEYVPVGLPDLNATTGPDGSFEWTNFFPPRHRDLIVIAEGFARYVKALESNGVNPGAIIDLGEIRLVTGTRISGVVVDADTQKPLSGATLLLCTMRFGGPFFRSIVPHLVRQSGEDGSFTIEHVPSSLAEYLLVAVTEDRCGWHKVSATQSSPKTLEYRIEAKGGAALSVRAQDPEGNPVGGVRILAFPAFPPLIHFHDRTPSHFIRDIPELQALFTATTDSEGRAQLSHLPHGERAAPYQIAHSLKGWTRSVVNTSIRSGTNELDITLYPDRPLVISGRVTHEDGRAFVGAKVNHRYEGVTVETDSQGEFRLPVKNPSKAQRYINASAEGYAKVQSQVQITPGKDPKPCNFVLSPSMPVSGQLVDEAGQGIASVQVNATCVSEKSRIRPFKITDNEGRFEFPDLKQGVWRVEVMFVDDRSKWKEPLPSLNVAERTNDLQLVMERATKSPINFVAKVIDIKTGEALSPVVSGSYLRHENTLQYLKPTCALGSVSAENLKQGTWVLKIKTDCGKTIEREFTATLNEPDIRLTLRLGGFGRIEGRVLFEGVARPSQVSVLTEQKGRAVKLNGESAGNFTEGFAPLDANNTFRFVDVPPGPVDITVLGAGIRSVVRINVAPDTTVPVTIAARGEAELIIRGAPDLSKTSIAIWTKTDRGPWVLSTFNSQLSGNAIEEKVPVAAGTVAYRLAIKPRNVHEEITGVVDIATGKSHIVDIDL